MSNKISAEQTGDTNGKLGQPAASASTPWAPNLDKHGDLNPGIDATNTTNGHDRPTVGSNGFPNDMSEA
jgi:hypothetical protein